VNEKRVLVVDDDQDICANIKDILDDLGYRTDTAFDGDAALQMVKTNRYDVAVLDYQMPGMDGATLHQEMIKLQPQIAAIMVTAHAQGDGAQRARDGGIQQILGKPVDLVELLNLVEEMSQSPIVLLVDDDLEFCQTLWQVLRERSYRVCIAHSVEEGLAKAAEAEYQVALIDLSLGHSMSDGCRVIEQVNRENPSARTIVITGHREAARSVIGDLDQSEASEVCYKPLELDVLIKLIDRGTNRV